jgi:NADH:ubiquinone oxidoreductase subunit E
MSRIEEFEIENRLIQANNSGLDAETSIRYAANSVHVSEDRVREVYEFLFNFQDRVAQKLSISI